MKTFVNENLCRLKVTKLWLSDKNYSRQKLKPINFSPISYTLFVDGHCEEIYRLASRTGALLERG